jgi:hypothetical protein
MTSLVSFVKLFKTSDAELRFFLKIIIDEHSEKYQSSLQSRKTTVK